MPSPALRSKERPLGARTAPKDFVMPESWRRAFRMEDGECRQPEDYAGNPEGLPCFSVPG
jgi:hypothetical protein